MPRGDFYILPANTDARRFVCQLVEDVWRPAGAVYLYVASEQQADMFDDLLWTFRDISFLPHHKMGPGHPDRQEDAAIMIGWGERLPVRKKTIINLTDKAPGPVLSFEQVIEVVEQDEVMKKLARIRYKHYRDLGLDLHTHRSLRE